MKYCGKRNPEQVWNIEKCYPSYMWVDDDERPDKSAKYEKNINRSKYIIFEPKLNWCKGKIEYEVEDKGECNYFWELPCKYVIEHIAIRGEDNDIEYAPDRSEKP